jgi:hypothetical protein
VPTTVQYFERARFELAPDAAPGAPLAEQVRLGLLGRELLAAGGAAALCSGAPTSALAADAPAAPVAQVATRQGAPAISGEDLALVTDVAAQVADGASGWIPILAVAALTVAILALAGFALSDWQSYKRRGARRGYRHRRSAYERFAPPPAQGPQGARQGTRAAADATQEVGGRGRPPADDPTPYEPPPAPRSAPAQGPPADDEDDLLRSLLGQ